MAEARKIPITEPDDPEVERRVDAMLDPTIPDAPTVEAQPVVAPPQANKITIVDASEGESTAPAPASAPPVKGKKAPKEPLRLTIKDGTADDAPETPVEPEVPSAPPVPKKVLVKIAEDVPPEASVSEPTVPPQKAEIAPKEPVEPAAEQPIVQDSGAPEEPVVAPVQDIPLDTPLDAELEDDATNKAVDDIAAIESDDLLASVDSTLDQKEKDVLLTPKPPRRSARKGLATFFADLWHSKIFRWGLFVLPLALLGGAGAWPTSRYLALNAVGVRGAASVTVIDQSTLLPLKDVDVTFGDARTRTDAQGVAKVDHVRLGLTSLTIQKRAFAPITESVTLGWGSNPLGSRSIKPVGTQFTLTVTDFLADKPVAGATASVGDADAQADQKGVIKLTMDHSESLDQTVTITAPDFRTETIKLDALAKQQVTIKMVPSQKVAYITKRSGKYDIYKVDADGKHDELVLAGTGAERDDTVLLQHPHANAAVLISTRDGKQNADGYTLSTLTFIDLNSNATQQIAQSEQIRSVGWAGDRFVYVQVAAGASAANPNRQRLMSYEYKSRDNRQLTSTNYFNAVLLAQDKIFYAPSSTYQAPGTVNGLFRVKADGSDRQTVLAKETWAIIRTAYDTISLSAANLWYEAGLDSLSPKTLDVQPGNARSRAYTANPEGKLSVWLDNRDGKNALIVYDVAAKNDRTVQARAGIALPVTWLTNNIITYRIKTNDETAQYVLNIDGGEPQKVTDITATGSVDGWYYY